MRCVPKLIWPALLALTSWTALGTPADAQFNRREPEKPGPATDPLPGPVRCIGEWEQSEGVLTLWRNADLINKLQADTHVCIPVSDEDSHQEWLDFLAENEVPTDNISFPLIPVNRIYTRDFGPFFVWDGNGDIGVVDYQYGRDEASEKFNKRFCDLFEIPYSFSGIRHVGGNYLPNAYRTAFSSTHVFEENPDRTRADILSVMETYFGVENYPVLSPKSIWHHDTWGKPCSPDTLIVIDFPEDNVYKHAAADDTVAYYETLESPWGRPYKILRLPMFEKPRSSRWEPPEPSIFNQPGGWYWGDYFSPPPAPKPKPKAKPAAEATAPTAETSDGADGTEAAEGAKPTESTDPPTETVAAEPAEERQATEQREPEPEPEPEPLVDPAWQDDLDWNQSRGPLYRPYMNSLVTNGRVYVPIDDCDDDAVALAVFQEAFPGYEIVGVDSGGTFSSDALHCRTRNFVRREQVRIYPLPPRDSEKTDEGYLVRAEVIAPNGSTLAEGQPTLLWSTTGGAPFESLAMQPAEGTHNFQVTIPPQEQGTTVSYYLAARDSAGRQAVYPPVAPKGLLSFEMRRDRRAPELSRFQPTRMASTSAWPPAVRLLAKDDMATPAVHIEYELNGVEQDDIPLERGEHTYWYSGTLAGKAQPGDLLSWRVVATDGSEAGNSSQLPRYGKIYSKVSAEADVGVVDLTSSGDAGRFIAQALGDLEVSARSYTSWPADWNAHDVWFVCFGVFADNHALTKDEAAEITAALEAGKSFYIEGGDTWCFDEGGELLDPMFGVEKLERGRGFEDLSGEPRSLVSGMRLEYVGENLFTDRIGAIAPATVLFSSDQWDRGRTVLNATENYRTIASTFSLAGLLDGAWPNNKREILTRYLEFLGKRKIALRSAGSAKPGEAVPVRIEGQPGDHYILLASRSEFFAELPGYGTLRLDPANMYTLTEGRIPRSGVARFKLEIPEDADTQNVEIHCQALVGKQLEPGSAHFTNRDILELTQ